MHLNDKSHIAPVCNVAPHTGTLPGLVSRTGFQDWFMLHLAPWPHNFRLPVVIYRCETGESAMRTPFQSWWGSNRWFVKAEIMKAQVLLEMFSSEKTALRWAWHEPLCFHVSMIKTCCCFVLFFNLNLLSRKDSPVYLYKINLTLAKFVFFRVSAPSKFAEGTTSSRPEAIPE